MQYQRACLISCLTVIVAGCGDDGAVDSSSGGTESSGATTQDASTTSSSSGSAGTTSTSATSATTAGSDSDPSGTSNAETSQGSTSDGTDTGSGGSSGGELVPMLEATGTFGADAFEVSCDFSTPLQGNISCNASRWLATCRPEPTAVGDIEVFQVWVVVPAEDATAGTKDLLDTQFGISIGDATAAVTPLSPTSTNATQNAITVDADAEALGPVTGSFDAAWADEGGQYGTISGTFAFDC